MLIASLRIALAIWSAGRRAGSAPITAQQPSKNAMTTNRLTGLMPPSVRTPGEIASRNAIQTSLRVDVVEAFCAQKEKCCRAIDVSDYEDLVELPGVGQDENSNRETENPLRPLFAILRGEVRNCDSGSESKEHVDEENEPHISDRHLTEEQNTAGEIDEGEIATVPDWILRPSEETEDASDKDDRRDREEVQQIAKPRAFLVVNGVFERLLERRVSAICADEVTEAAADADFD